MTKYTLEFSCINTLPANKFRKYQCLLAVCSCPYLTSVPVITYASKCQPLGQLPHQSSSLYMVGKKNLFVAATKHFCYKKKFPIDEKCGATLLGEIPNPIQQKSKNGMQELLPLSKKTPNEKVDHQKGRKQPTRCKSGCLFGMLFQLSFHNGSCFGSKSQTTSLFNRLVVLGQSKTPSIKQENTK